jgi:hypothetical protein
MIAVSLTKAGKLIELLECPDIMPREQQTDETDENYELYLADCESLENFRITALKQNSLNRGYSDAEIDIKLVTNEEWVAIQEANKPVPTYADLRRAEYPPIADYLDAKAKQSSSDPAILSEGLAQEETYLAACIAVKTKYPKPE